MRGTNPPISCTFVHVSRYEFVPAYVEILEEKPKALYF